MTWLRALVLCLLAASQVSPALAEEAEMNDGIATAGRLSDADFLRLATCGAVPGGPCRGPVLRWVKPQLTVRLARNPAADNTPVRSGFESRLMTALHHALDEINGAGAGISLGFTNAPVADITVRLTQLGEGDVLTEKPGFSGAGVMGVGYMTVWSNDRNQIVEAVILISTSITDADMTSVVLEELTQSLGFLYDIENPAYENVSILSQTSNETEAIAGQDATLLRLHYPPKP